jgi:hypothetical protein
MSNGFGHVLTGLWMQSPEDVDIMLRSLEARLRNIAIDDPDRPLLEKWRGDALNVKDRSVKQEWTGWV